MVFVLVTMLGLLSSRGFLGEKYSVDKIRAFYSVGKAARKKELQRIVVSDAEQREIDHAEREAVEEMMHDEDADLDLPEDPAIDQS